MDSSHFDIVEKFIERFDCYLFNTRGADADTARTLQLRNDSIAIPEKEKTNGGRLAQVIAAVNGPTLEGRFLVALVVVARFSIRSPDPREIHLESTLTTRKKRKRKPTVTSPGPTMRDTRTPQHDSPFRHPTRLLRSPGPGEAKADIMDKGVATSTHRMIPGTAEAVA